MEQYDLDDVDNLQTSEKRLRTDENPQVKKEDEKEKEKEEGGEEEASSSISRSNKNNNNNNNNNININININNKKRKRTFVKMLAVKPITDIRGHTGYLTFARRL